MQKKIEYSEAVKTKYPEQVVIVIAKDSNGKANPVTLGWVMSASSNPPMWAIAVNQTHHTTSAIRHSKCFTLAFPSSYMQEAALFYGTRSGKTVDKLKEFPTNTEPAQNIDSLLLSDAIANFECLVESEHIAGDHVLFIGKIVAAYINTEPFLRLYTIGPGHKMGAVPKTITP